MAVYNDPPERQPGDAGKRNAAMDMIDPFGRTITYLRVSVTDRCDFRCTYCMAEDMTFLPKKDLLSLEELDRLCTVFIEKGVRKLRLTGGEPLVRKNIMHLVRQLVAPSRERRARRADADHQRLAACALRRRTRRLRRASASTSRSTRSIRTSSSAITRWGDLAKVMDGIDAAQAAGLKVKLNAVALKGFNDAEIPEHAALGAWPRHGSDLIETMPMGEIDADRTDQYLPLSLLRADLERAVHADRHPLQDRRPGPLCRGRGDRRAARLHHADDP